MWKTAQRGILVSSIVSQQTQTNKSASHSVLRLIIHPAQDLRNQLVVTFATISFYLGSFSKADLQII